MANEVYYGDVCKICFKATQSKCSTCNLISHCCVAHQNMDSHKSICIALKNIQNKLKCTQNCSFEDFTKYREDFKLELKKKLDSLSSFETQICEFSWVCVVCYSNKNSIFPCEECMAIVYCSLEHKEKDADQHEPNCKNLKLCRIFDSLPYDHGFPFVLQQIDLQEIPRSVKYFPKNIHEYSSLVQNQLTLESTKLNEIVNYIKFNDSFAAPTIMLYALNKIGLMEKRKFISCPDLSKSERLTLRHKRVTAQISALDSGMVLNFTAEPQMVIHIVAPSKYEKTLYWGNITSVLTNWLLNVEYIKFFVVGLTINNSFHDFMKNSGFADIQMLSKNYKEVAKKLPKPDLVVLFNYGPKKVSTEEFNDRDSQRALFKHKGVPLVVTSTQECVLNNFIEKLKLLPNVLVQIDSHKNPFAEARPYRIWDKKCPSTYSNNSFIAVLVRN